MIMNKRTKIPAFFKLVLSTGALWLLTGASVDAQILSANISSGVSPSNAAIDGAETFGVASEGTVVGNWNNLTSFGAANPTAGLVDSTGAATGVSATVVNGGGNQFWGADYINTPWNYGVSAFTGTANPVSVSFSGLNAQFASGYFAIVYVNGAAANPGAAVTDGVTTYVFQTSNPANTTPLLITDTNSGDGYDVGNYAIFGSSLAPLTSDSITFSIPTGSVVANNAGIGGVQLVAVPEPGIMALVAGLATLVLIGVRRRRS